MTVKTKKMQVCFLKSKFSFLIVLRSKRLNSKPKSKKFPNSSTIFRTHSRLLKIFKPRFLSVKSLKMVKHLLNLPVQCLWEKALLMKKKSMQKMKKKSMQKMKNESKMKKESKNLQNPKVLLRKGKRPKPKKMLWKNQKRINKPRPKLHNQRSKILIRKKKMLLKASSKILIRKPKKKALKKIKSGSMKNSSLDL